MRLLVRTILVDGEFWRTPAAVKPFAVTPLFPLPGTATSISRRSFLQGTTSFVAAALLSTRARGVVASSPRFSNYPFSLGVASGDPSLTGVVLWTRLAPDRASREAECLWNRWRFPGRWRKTR